MAAPAPHLCRCGCGAPVPPSRAFAPGCWPRVRNECLARNNAATAARAAEKAGPDVRECPDCHEEFPRCRGEPVTKWRRRVRCPDCAHARRLAGLKGVGEAAESAVVE